jgi:hypothetical protein
MRAPEYLPEERELFTKIGFIPKTYSPDGEQPPLYPGDPGRQEREEEMRQRTSKVTKIFEIKGEFNRFRDIPGIIWKKILKKG